jgi:hypothetical protein
MPINIIVISNKAILGIFKLEIPSRFKYTINMGEPQHPDKKQNNHKIIVKKPPAEAAFKAFFLPSLNFKKENVINATDKA